MSACTTKWKQSLICSYCSKLFKDPIELPCDDCICQEHLFENNVLKANKIQCVKCKQEFEVNGINFKINKFAKQMLDEQKYFSDEEISLRQKIDESIRVFYQMYEDFILGKTKLDLDCHNHFQEVRFQLDEHREKLKEKIDDIYMEMIEKTKEFEASYLKSLSEKLEASLKSFEIKSVDQELKHVEETFRDPNLLIELIREIKNKHQDAIATIQLKFNEMNQVRDQLKASIEFIPNLAFNQDVFGLLYLIEDSRFDPFKSQILTGQQPSELIKLCEFNPKDKFTLLYRGSIHGFSSNNFHSKCDGKANTLTIIKVCGTSFIFGAFTTAVWDCSNQFKSDPNAFLFSLTNKENKPCKMKIDSNRHQYAIICNSQYGPVFGGSPHSDIYIASNANTLMTSCSHLCHNYKHPQYALGSNEAQSFLAGSYQFQLNDIEVFLKE